MKKIIPFLAVVGSAAALVAYKMKKEEKKQVIDLDQGLLFDEENEDNEETIEEAPISNPNECCEGVEEAFEEAHDALDEVPEMNTDSEEETADDMENVDSHEEYDEMFTHLTRAEMALLKEDSDARLASLEQKGDVHDHERPVQHYIQFHSDAEMNEFKNMVINRGYVITKGSEEFELIVLHITPMDIVKLMANVYYLADAAATYGGIYKGWQSKVVY